MVQVYALIDADGDGVAEEVKVPHRQLGRSPWAGMACGHTVVAQAGSSTGWRM
jgi:hypothetical protein